MLDQFLLTQYSQEQQKTASRQLIDKLKTFPLDELLKCASGDPTSKLAFAECAMSGVPASWVDQFKGTPLFDQAVEIERAQLELDSQEQSRRQETRAVEQQTWDARDALSLKRRMLALELATSQGGGGPEAAEEKGVQMLEQAQAQERAEGEGGEPHEQAEDQAIQQFRAAQSQEAAAKAQQPPKKPGPGAEVDTPETDPAEEKPKEEKPKGMSVEVKQAGAWGSDSRRVAPGSNSQVQSSDSGQGAGSLTAAVPGENESFHTVVSTKEAAAEAAGRVLATVGLRKEALSHGRIIDAVRKAPEGRLGKAFDHGVDLLGKAKSNKLTDQADTLATAASARLAGGNWKRELTNLKALRKTSTGTADEVKAEVGKKYPALVKKEASVPAAAAGAVAGAHKAQSHGRDARAGVIRGAAGAVGGSTIGQLIGTALGERYGKGPLGGALGAVAGGVGGYKALTRGFEKKEAGVLGAVSAAAPKLMAGVGGALNAGKNLAQTAHAAGGLPQVAKSFGNVAAQFAQKNPLAAAGVAGGAGLLAGRALGGGQR